MPPTLIQTVVLAEILTAISIGLVISQPGPQLIQAMKISGALALLMLLPVLAASVAAVITANDAATETFTLQKMTALTKAAVVWGYASASLFRLRMLIALIIALLPWLLADSSDLIVECHILVSGSLLDTSRIPYDYSDLPCIPQNDIRLVLLGVNQVVLTVVAAVAWCVIGTLLGVALGLLLKRRVPALLMGALIMVIITTAYIGLLVFVLANGYGCPTISTRCTLGHWWPDPLWYAVVIMTSIALLTFAVDRLARRAV
jgi:hypothetical protein